MVDDPQLCFFLPKPTDYRRGEPVPPPSTMLTGDTAGCIHEWDLYKKFKGCGRLLTAQLQTFWAEISC